MDVKIYFNSGLTAHYKEVENFGKRIDYDETIITLDYFGVLSQPRKHAEFNNANIAGYAITKGYEQD